MVWCISFGFMLDHENLLIIALFDLEAMEAEEERAEGFVDDKGDAGIDEQELNNNNNKIPHFNGQEIMLPQMIIVLLRSPIPVQVNTILLETTHKKIFFQCNVY